MRTGQDARTHPPRGGATVVLVEEHPVLLQRFAGQLADAGLAVVAAAGTLGSGLDAVLRYRPDVAVIGTGLPDGRGVELCRAVCDALPSLVVLLHASVSTRAEELEAKEAGAAGVVPKAIRGGALAAAVLAHLPIV